MRINDNIESSLAKKDIEKKNKENCFILKRQWSNEIWVYKAKIYAKLISQQFLEPFPFFILNDEVSEQGFEWFAGIK